MPYCEPFGVVVILGGGELTWTAFRFRLERFILRAAIGARSTDADARAVADGTGMAFAAWTVADRTTTQLLMCDLYEATRS